MGERDDDNIEAAREQHAIDTGSLGRLIVGPFAASSEAKIERSTEERYCRHEGYVIDPSERTVECARCAAKLEPFTVLLEYAERERRWRHWSTEEGAVRKRVHELKEEEKRVKLRTRQHDRKDAEVAVRAERRRIFERLHHLAFDARRIVEFASKIERGIGSYDEIAELVNPSRTDRTEQKNEGASHA